MQLRLIFMVGVILAMPIPAFGQSELTYWQDIRPILRRHCIVCHSSSKVRKVEVSGGLALDTFEAARKGSKRAVITAGDSAKSVLYQMLVSADEKTRMPLESDPLSKEKIALIKKWIDTGAKEGPPPKDVVTLPTKKAVTRKLDVVIPTTTTPPSGVPFGLKATGKLDLAMKVGPLAPVTAVAFNHDSTLLAVGSYGQVVVWDLSTAKPVKLLTNVLGAVHDLRFSPKGDILAVGGGQPSVKGDLRLYQVSDWKLLAAMRGHDDVVYALAFSHDGQHIATASFDHSVRLWNVQSHDSVRTYQHHSDSVYAVAFSPDSKQLVSASKDRTVQLFDRETGKSIFTFSGMENDVMAVAFAPDGKAVISSGFEAGIFWWNPKSGEKIKTQGGHGIATHELAFSKDGKRIVSAGADRTVRTWDGVAGTALKVFPVGSVAYSVAISPNNKLIASGSYDGLVRVWDEASARHLATFLAYAADGDQPEWLALTPEGYAAGSDKLVSQVRWRINGQEVPAATVWTAVQQPQTIVRALRGDTVLAPTFEKK